MFANNGNITQGLRSDTWAGLPSLTRTGMETVHPAPPGGVCALAKHASPNLSPACAPDVPCTGVKGTEPQAKGHKGTVGQRQDAECPAGDWPVLSEEVTLKGKEGGG